MSASLKELLAEQEGQLADRAQQLSNYAAAKGTVSETWDGFWQMPRGVLFPPSASSPSAGPPSAAFVEVFLKSSPLSSSASGSASSSIGGKWALEGVWYDDERPAPHGSGGSRKINEQDGSSPSVLCKYTVRGTIGESALLAEGCSVHRTVRRGLQAPQQQRRSNQKEHHDHGGADISDHDGGVLTTATDDARGGATGIAPASLDGAGRVATRIADGRTMRDVSLFAQQQREEEEEEFYEEFVCPLSLKAGMGRNSIKACAEWSFARASSGCGVGVMSRAPPRCIVLYALSASSSSAVTNNDTTTTTMQVSVVDDGVGTATTASPSSSLPFPAPRRDARTSLTVARLRRIADGVMSLSSPSSSTSLLTTPPEFLFTFHNGASGVETSAYDDLREKQEVVGDNDADGDAANGLRDSLSMGVAVAEEQQRVVAEASKALIERDRFFFRRQKQQQNHNKEEENSSGGGSTVETTGTTNSASSTLPSSVIASPSLSSDTADGAAGDGGGGIKSAVSKAVLTDWLQNRELAVCWREGSDGQFAAEDTVVGCIRIADVVCDAVQRQGRTCIVPATMAAVGQMQSALINAMFVCVELAPQPSAAASPTSSDVAGGSPSAGEAADNGVAFTQLNQFGQPLRVGHYLTVNGSFASEEAAAEGLARLLRQPLE